MKIRLADASDARAIAEVHVASWIATYRGLVADRVLDDLTVEHREAQWREIFEAEESFTVIAEVDGSVAGFCSARPGEILATYVHPARIGAGIGKALMAYALDRLREGGSTEARLWVFEENHHAVAFYERLGFAPDGGRTTHGDWAEGAIAIRMVANLGGAGVSDLPAPHSSSAD